MLSFFEKDLEGHYSMCHFLSIIFKHDVHVIIIIMIIIIIISIFKEDKVFSITASLPYGPPVNKDIDF